MSPEHRHDWQEERGLPVPAVVGMDGNYICDCGAVTHALAGRLGGIPCLMCSAPEVRIREAGRTDPQGLLDAGQTEPRGDSSAESPR